MSNGVWFSISVWNMDTLHRGFCFLLMLWGCVNLSTSVDVISVDDCEYDFLLAYDSKAPGADPKTSSCGMGERVNVTSDPKDCMKILCDRRTSTGTRWNVLNYRYTEGGAQSCYIRPCEKDGGLTEENLQFTATPDSDGRVVYTIVVNECTEIDPCKNGAVCNDLLQGYECRNCPNTHTGINCDTKMNCSHNPCEHGKCLDTDDGGYNCVCYVGYSGVQCDTYIADGECNVESAVQCTNTPNDQDTCEKLGCCFNTSCYHSDGGPYALQPQYCTAEILKLEDREECGYHGIQYYECVYERNCCFYTVDDGPWCFKPNRCSDDPCMNGGTCTNGEDAYNCTCTDFYTGSTCDTDINECNDSPCDNGATCVNLNGSFRCTCADGYTGDTCETDINECDNADICNNQGNCTDQPGSFQCACEERFTGVRCESEITSCTSAPCDNGGTCEVVMNGYSCNCTDTGYTGVNCTEDVNECADADFCDNDGQCTNLPGSFQCACGEGFTGVRCESDLNECADADYCDNDGECTNLPGSFQCTCKEGFTGVRCESENADSSGNTANQHTVSIAFSVLMVAMVIAALADETRHRIVYV